jgi:hypothetical protein
MLALLLLLGACNNYPKTPEDALAQVEKVVTSGDGLLAWEIVDADTKSSVASVYANDRMMRTIIKAKYPAAEADRELGRLADADQPDIAHFFAAMESRWQTIQGYRKRLGSISGPIKTKPDGATSMYVARQDGMPFHLVKAGSGWAWNELRGEWMLEKDRAAHALTTVKDNAALYKKDEAK